MAATGKILSRVIGGGFTAFTAVSAFNESRENGNGVVNSTAKAGLNVMLTETMGLRASFGMMGAQLAGTGIVAGGQKLNRMARDMQRQSVPTVFTNANFMDTQANYTMRQAGMKLAEASKFNLQQTIMGNEARYIGQ